MKQLSEAAAAGQSGTAAQVRKVLEHKLPVLDFALHIICLYRFNIATVLSLVFKAFGIP